MNIDKTISEYVNELENDTSDVLTSDKKERSEEFIGILFDLVKEELDTIHKRKSQRKVLKYLEDINALLEKDPNISKKKIIENYNKVIKRINRAQKNKPLSLMNKMTRELDSMRKLLCNQKEKAISRRIPTEKRHDTQQEEVPVESNKYDCTMYLIESIKNIDYLENVFKKMPGLVNIKDESEVCLFRNIIRKYFDSVKNNNEEDSLYYSNIISLILSQEKFSLTTSDKKDVLNDIYTVINHMSINKKIAKKNKEQLAWLKNIVDAIKGETSPKLDISDISTRYNIPVEFREILREEAGLVELPKQDLTDRYYVDDYIVTIDGEDAFEIDDALSCKKLSNGNYLLGVHIASILSYFPYESEIVEEALRRTRTIYLPRPYELEDGKESSIIPILPYEFSANAGSLLQEVPRYARSYYFEIDKDGYVVNEKFVKSVISSNKKASYEEVDEIIEHGSTNPQLQETILNLAEVANILGQRYKPTKDYEEQKENTTDYSNLRVKRVGAQKIVYQAMVLTCNRVAEYFGHSREGYPCLYRVHENNTENQELQKILSSLTDCYGDEQFKNICQGLETIYPAAHYDLSGGHAGLGLDHYCHCTSGLRRGADIVVEHALEVCYDNRPTDNEIALLEEEIKRRANEINSKINPIDWFVRDYNRTYQKTKGRRG